MTTATILMKEIETLPEESMAEALDFIAFLKERKGAKLHPKISIENTYGIFNGIDTLITKCEGNRDGIKPENFSVIEKMAALESLVGIVHSENPLFAERYAREDRLYIL